MEVKKPTTFEQQIEKLKERGCIIGDETYAKQVLQQINYYRLTAYFLPFTNNKGKYYANTTFNMVHRTYLFDSQLLCPLLKVVLHYFFSTTSHAFKLFISSMETSF